MADRDRLIREIECGAKLNSLSWSPDGTRLLVGFRDGHDNVRVMTPEGRELWRASPFAAFLQSLAWSPDGRWVAAGSSAGLLVVLNSTNGNTVRRIESIAHGGGVAWSPDSSRLAVASGSSDDSASVWVVEASSGTVEATFRTETRSVCGLDWAPNGSRLAVAFGSAVPARILDARSGRLLATLPQATVAMKGAIRWAPDADLVMFAASSSGVYVCEAGTGNVRSSFTGHSGEANWVSWGPDGRVVASGGDDRTVRIWNADTGAERATLFGHTTTVWAVAFAPDGRVLASRSDDGKVRLWDVSDLCGAAVRASTTAVGPESAYLTRQLATVGLRPAGQSAPAGMDLWVPTGLPGADSATKCLGVIGASPHALTLFSDGRHLLGGIRGGKRWAKWSLATGRPEWTVAGPEVERGYDAAVSPDGSRVAIGAIYVARENAWVSSGPGEPINPSPNGHFSQDSASVAAWSPDGQRVVWGSFGTNDVRVQDAATGELIARLGYIDKTGSWNSVDWSAPGRFIAGGGNVSPGRVEVWTDGFAPHWSTNTPEAVTAARFSPDGRHLASGESDGRIVIWDADTGRSVNEFRVGPIPIHRFAWSPDGRFLAVTSGDIGNNKRVGDGFLRVLDLGTGTEVWRCEGLSKERPGLVWAPGGGFLAAGCSDGVRLWDVRHLMARSVSTGPAKTAVVPKLKALPAALAAVHRAGRFPPLSLLVDALALVAGRPPSEPALVPLSADAGVARLAALHWPPAAHPALAALLLAEFPVEAEWTPPPSLPPTRLRRDLASALNAFEAVPAAAPPVPARVLAAGAARVTAGVATALAAVGPAACALDPSLPLRLAARPAAPPRRQPPRRGLSATTGGTAGVGPVSQGGGRAGSAKSGPPQAVNPWQWALPPTVLDARARRGELVYRAAPADPPIPARPAVVVLDTSASASGAAGVVLRASAAALLRSALSAGGAALVSAGGGWSGPVRSEADLAGVWSIQVRSGRARAVESLAAAGRLRAGLGSGAVLAVLAGPWFGWSEPGAVKALTDACGASGGRGAFAGPPGWSGRPALAPGLVRWLAAPADRFPPPLDLLAPLLA